MISDLVYTSGNSYVQRFGITTGQVLEVSFTSDYSINYGGFTLSYMEVDRSSLRKLFFVIVLCFDLIWKGAYLTQLF